MGRLRDTEIVQGGSGVERSSAGGTLDLFDQSAHAMKYAGLTRQARVEVANLGPVSQQGSFQCFPMPTFDLHRGGPEAGEWKGGATAASMADRGWI